MPANVADITIAVPLPETVGAPGRPIADQAYDADRLRRQLAERRLTAVIPSTVPRSTIAPVADATRSTAFSAC